MKKIFNRYSYLLIVILFVFLPFSSWLVSLTSNQWLSVLRDILVLIFALLVAINLKKSQKSVFIFTILFIIYGALTFFWKEASALQWLKGFRFTFMPIIMFAGLLLADFSQSAKKTIYKTILWSGLVIAGLAVLEYFGVQIPLTLNHGTPEEISALHRVGNLNIHRIQSVLAGPNAFGLYLAALCGISLGIGKTKKINWYFWLFFILAIFTFSRSCWLAIAAILILFLYLYLKSMQRRRLALSIFVSCIIGLFTFVGILYSNSSTQDLITHNDSTSRRIEQYQRIWNTKNEIGLFGRGSGTAGPSSQYRLDNGENHWTENIYLDLFEELGLIGLIFYLSLLTAIGFYLISGFNFNNNEQLSALLLFGGFLIAGVSINYYTGQAGIYLYWLIIGLAISAKKQ